jgi:hypothetical protein
MQDSGENKGEKVESTCCEITIELENNRSPLATSISADSAELHVESVTITVTVCSV